MMVSFVLSFFPRDVLDEILNLIESVSEDFPSYSFCIMTDVIRSLLLDPISAHTASHPLFVGTYLKQSSSKKVNISYKHLISLEFPLYTEPILETIIFAFDET